MLIEIETESVFLWTFEDVVDVFKGMYAGLYVEPVTPLSGSEKQYVIDLLNEDEVACLAVREAIENAIQRVLTERK